MPPKPYWTLEKLREGFKKFFRENGHYPTTPEIDDCDYLPSSRQIQRSFGGSIKLRGQLGLPDTNFGIGKFRSAIAYSRNKTGFAAERELEKVLVAHFGEPFVHIEKPIGKTGRQRLDFFVYAKGVRFGVDIFYSTTKRDIPKNINIKIDNYSSTDLSIYFVLANPNISQSVLDEIARSKPRKPLPKNIKLITLQKFIALIKTIAPQA